MATWRIDRDLRVTYRRGGVVHDCGTAKDSKLPDVETWVACEAHPWDLVVSEHGRFVRQQDPTLFQ